LLLGLWASAGQENINNEIAALNSAISQYGGSFTDLIVGVSVGSEDLYRNSPTGIDNLSGAGANPADIVAYINQVRAALSNAGINKPVGHVDTWTAYVNESNSAVIAACDFLGMDAYPYYQVSVQTNDIYPPQFDA
jgi:glucan endo-1,3-beta-D-glucosidase